MSLLPDPPNRLRVVNAPTLHSLPIPPALLRTPAVAQTRHSANKVRLLVGSSRLQLKVALCLVPSDGRQSKCLKVNAETGRHVQYLAQSSALKPPLPPKQFAFDAVFTPATSNVSRACVRSFADGA